MSDIKYRQFTLDRSTADDEKREIRAALSTDTPVRQYGTNEVLSHKKGAIDLSRAKDGLPLLWAHDQTAPIGIVENLKIDNESVLRGTLRFSKNPKATEIWADVRDGFLKNVSIGYSYGRSDFEEIDESSIIVNNWALHEASIVTVPADQAAGVNRSFKGDSKVSDKETKPTDSGGEFKAADFLEVQRDAEKRGETKAAEKLSERNREVMNCFDGWDGPEFRDLERKALLESWTPEQTTRAILSMVQEGVKPIAPKQSDDSAPSTRASVGETDKEKFARGMSEAIELRGGLIKDRAEQKKLRAENEFTSFSIVEMAREYLVVNGAGVRGLGRDAIIKQALTRSIPGHGVGDFTNILENIAGKAALVGYNEAPETWRQWVRIGELSDFKAASRTALSAFSDLAEVGEFGEYTEGSFSDVKEAMQLKTYGRLFSISRQALVNDDLSELTKVPRAMGRAANRMVGDEVYNRLINGTTETLDQDATALFAAGHGNYVAGGSGAAPSVATINAARTAMGTQTDPSGNATLNYSPRFLIVPLALEGTAKAIETAEYNPAIASGREPNTVRGTFTTIADARLDADDAAKWYMAGDPNLTDTIEAAFLDGNDEPYIEQQEGWTIDGVSYKVRLDVEVEPLDFRALYHNDGN